MPETDTPTFSPAPVLGSPTSIYDNGHPIEVKRGIWVRWDGVVSGHSGYAPYELPAPTSKAEMARLLALYNMAKRKLAERQLKMFEHCKRTNAPAYWNEKYHGKHPVRMTEYGPQGDVDAAIMRLRSIWTYHDEAVKLHTAVLEKHGYTADIEALFNSPI
jgi:hypothetical protein